MPDAQRPTLDRMLYLDDSGSSLSGLVVYGWVEVAPCDWGSALREWLTLRKELVRDHRVPVTAELHCTEYVQGRGVSGFGHISTSPPARFRTTRVSVDGANSEMVLWKDLGREVAERCLTVLARSPTMRVGAVWQRTPAKGSAYAAEKYALVRALPRAAGRAPWAVAPAGETARPAMSTSVGRVRTLTVPPGRPGVQ